MYIICLQMSNYGPGNFNRGPPPGPRGPNMFDSPTGRMSSGPLDFHSSSPSRFPFNDNQQGTPHHMEMNKDYNDRHGNEESQFGNQGPGFSSRKRMFIQDVTEMYFLKSSLDDITLPIYVYYQFWLHSIFSIYSNC